MSERRAAPDQVEPDKSEPPDKLRVPDQKIRLNYTDVVYVK